MRVREYKVWTIQDSQKQKLMSVVQYLRCCEDTWAYIESVGASSASLIVVCSTETAADYSEGYVTHRLALYAV